MLSINSELIRETQFAKEGRGLNAVTNYLYGLYDGYLYNNLCNVDYLKKEGYTKKEINKIQNLITLIKRRNMFLSINK